MPTIVNPNHHYRRLPCTLLSLTHAYLNLHGLRTLLTLNNITSNSRASGSPKTAPTITPSRPSSRCLSSALARNSLKFVWMRYCSASATASSSLCRDAFGNEAPLPFGNSCPRRYSDQSRPVGHGCCGCTCGNKDWVLRLGSFGGRSQR